MTSRLHRILVRLLALIAAASATPALARIDDSLFCRNGLFPTQQSALGMARVSGKGRAYFFDDMDNCPKAERRCRTSRYLVPGDRLLTGRKHGAFTCAFFPTRGGGAAGWVESNRLRAMAVNANPPLVAWLGSWGDNEIRFSSRRGALHVEGEAFWPAPDIPPMNSGEIAGPVRRSGIRARYASDGCVVDFTLLNDLLVVGDNLGCGGNNVSFTGVYARKSKRR